MNVCVQQAWTSSNMHSLSSVFSGVKLSPLQNLLKGPPSLYLSLGHKWWKHWSNLLERATRKSAAYLTSWIKKLRWEKDGKYSKLDYNSLERLLNGRRGEGDPKQKVVRNHPSPPPAFLGNGGTRLSHPPPWWKLAFEVETEPGT